MSFESILLSVIGVLALVIALCVGSIILEARRRRANPLFGRRPSLSVSTNENRPAATVVERRQTPTVAERPRFDMRTNGGMF